MRPLPALLVDVVIHHLAEAKKWEFHKIAGTFLGIPIIRTIGY